MKVSWKVAREAKGNKTMPKILVLSSHTKSLLWFRVDMMRAFMAKGHEVVAAGQEPENDWKGAFEKEGIRYRSISVSRNGLNPLKDIETYRSIFQLLESERPDKIFCYQAKTIIYGCIAASRLGITEVYPLIAGLGSVFRGTGLKNAVIRTIMKMEYGFALKRARKVMFQNRDDLSYFVDSKLVSSEKASIINGSGVDVEKFSPMPLPEKASFLMTARLIRDKGVMEYLAAARIVKKRHPDVLFMLAGPFDSNPSAISKAEVDDYVLDGTVEYLGELDDVRPSLGRASVFVLPSYHEGTPKTVLEAMSCGRAVITTDAPGCRDAVQDGVNGILVPVRSVEGIAEAMEKAIAEPALCGKFGDKGRMLAEEKYDVRKVNASIMELMGV